MIFKHAVAFTGLSLSAILVLAGHFEADPGLSPWADTISDFAASDRGGPVEFAMGLAALSTLPLVAKGRFLLGLWSAALLVATIVPTDPAGHALSTMGYVHRYASAVAFAALLAAGWRIHRGLTIVGAVSGAAMLASAYLLDRFAIGLTERVMALAGIGLLLTLTTSAPNAYATARLRYQ
ncbi:MAG TPA: DUF998 domain-containing protein [Candidatus Limnocylindrales bacterium]